MSEAQVTPFTNYSDIPQVERVRRVIIAKHLEARQIQFPPSAPKDILLVIAQANGINVLSAPPVVERPKAEEAVPVEPEAPKIDVPAATLGERPDVQSMKVPQLKAYIRDHSAFSWNDLDGLNKEQLVALLPQIHNG